MGDNPYVFHKTAWNRLKSQRTARIIEKASNGDGKSIKAFGKLLTSKIFQPK